MRDAGSIMISDVARHSLPRLQYWPFSYRLARGRHSSCLLITSALFCVPHRVPHLCALQHQRPLPWSHKP